MQYISVILASSYGNHFFVDLPAIFFALCIGFYGLPTIDDCFHLAAHLSVRIEVDFPGPKSRAHGCKCTAFYIERNMGGVRIVRDSLIPDENGDVPSLENRASLRSL